VSSRPHLQAWLQDSKNAAAYIEAALAEGDSGDLLHALRNVAEARGGIAHIAASVEVGGLYPRPGARA
jgi:DNA-binding phage protein